MSREKRKEMSEDVPDMEVEYDESEDPFAEVRRNNNKPQGLWKTMNLILSAVDEVIKLQQTLAKDAPTTYFTAFVSAVEKEKNEQHVGSLIELLNTIINRVPSSLLRSQYVFLSTLLTSVAERFATSTIVMRPLLTLGTSILLAQDGDFWSRALNALESGVSSSKPASKTNKKAMSEEDIESLAQIPLLNMLFTLVCDVRPKVRKRSHNCIYLLISSGRPTISKYCSFQLSQVAGKVLSACTTKDYQASLHLIGLLKVVLPYMSSTLVSAICRMLLRLPALNHPIVSLLTYQAFTFLFSSDDDNLPAVSLANILKGLHELDTNRAHTKLTVTYTNMMTQGLIKLYNLDRDAGVQRLPDYFTQMMLNFQCEPEDITLPTRQAMKKIIKACIDEQLILEALPATANSGKAKAKATASNKQGATVLEAIIAEFEKALNYKTKGNIDLILDVQGTLFKRLGRHAYPLLVSLVQVMEQLHVTKDFHFQASLEKAMGAAIRSMGPEKFLSIIPLNIEDEEGPNRQWLLPLLRKNIIHTELGYFIRNMLPLSRRLLARIKTAAEEDRPVEAKNLQNIHDQVWALLPGFCTYPTDLPQTFKLIAKDLGMTIKEDDDSALNGGTLRGIVCTALLRLINKNKHIIDGIAEPLKTFNVTTEEAEANLKAIAVYSRNFLPILFNTYANTSSEKRGILADTITAFASITEKKVLNELYMTLLTKIAESINSITPQDDDDDDDYIDDANERKRPPVAPHLLAQARDRKCSMTELATALSPALEDETVSYLYRIIMPNLKDDSDAKLQKRSYKALESLAKHHSNYISTHAKEIFHQLAQYLSKCPSSSKKYRLRCYGALLDALYDRDKLVTYLPQVLGEVIICVKELNTKTRECAYDMVIGLAKKFAFGSADFDLEDDDSDDDDDDDESNDSDSDDGSEGENNSGSRSGLRNRKVTVEHEHYLQQFFTTVLAGLGGSSSTMISATVVALSRLLFEFYVYIESVLPDVLNSVLLLIHHSNREIVTSVLGFIKVCIVIFSNQFLENYLPTMVPALLKHSSKPQSGEMLQTIKVIFERLLRKYGYEDVEKYFPEEHKKFISSIRKQKKRKEAKKSKMTKKTLNEKQKQSSQNRITLSSKDSKTHQKKKARNVAYEEALFGSDDEGIDGPDNNNDVDEDEAFLVPKKKAKHGAANSTDLMLIQENAGSDDPLNLLDPISINKMVSSRPKKHKEKDYSLDFKRDKATGKFIIDESDDEDENGGIVEGELMVPDGKGGFVSASGGKRGAKRARRDDDDELTHQDEEDRMPLGMGVKDDYMDAESEAKTKEASATAATTSNAILQRRMVRAKRNKKPEANVLGMEQFKPKDKKTGGDVKRGTVDPFAYIPLDPRSLNKRVKNKAFKKFEKDTRKSRKSTAAAQRVENIKNRTKDAKKK